MRGRATNSVASLIRALMPDGPHAAQHAMCCDVTLWAVDRLRHGTREHPLTSSAPGLGSWCFGTPFVAPRCLANALFVAALGLLQGSDASLCFGLGEGENKRDLLIMRSIVATIAPCLAIHIEN